MCRKLSWRRVMAEKALRYDATCHHFRVTVTTRGHALLPKEPSPAMGGRELKGSCLDPAGFASTWLFFSPTANQPPLRANTEPKCSQKFSFPEMIPKNFPRISVV